MTTLSLVIETEKGVDRDYAISDSSHKCINNIVNLLRGLNSGAFKGTIDVHTSSTDPVAASGTYTLTSAVATDAVTLGTVTLTASSTPADEDEWEIDGADDAADAASLAAAINAHSVLGLIVTATSASNVVTVTYNVLIVTGKQIGRAHV